MTEPNKQPVLLTMLVLKSPRLGQVKRFYEALGIDFAEEQHPSGPVHFAGRVGGILLELYPLTDEVLDENSVRLGFAVRDLEGTMDRLHAAGAPVVSHPKQTVWGRRAVIRDADGRTVEIYQR